MSTPPFHDSSPELETVRLEIGPTRMWSEPGAIVTGMDFAGQSYEYFLAFPGKEYPKTSEELEVNLPADIVRAMAGIFKANAWLNGGSRGRDLVPADPSEIPEEYDCSTLAHFTVGCFEYEFDGPTLPAWQFLDDTEPTARIKRLCQSGSTPQQLNTGDGHWYVHAGKLDEIGLAPKMMRLPTDTVQPNDQIGLHVLGTGGPLIFSLPETIREIYRSIDLNACYSATFQR